MDSFLSISTFSLLNFRENIFNCKLTVLYHALMLRKWLLPCTVSPKEKKKKNRNNPIYFNVNYCTEMYQSSCFIYYHLLLSYKKKLFDVSCIFFYSTDLFIQHSINSSLGSFSKFIKKKKNPFCWCFLLLFPCVRSLHFNQQFWKYCKNNMWQQHKSATDFFLTISFDTLGPNFVQSWNCIISGISFITDTNSVCD